MTSMAWARFASVAVFALLSVEPARAAGTCVPTQPDTGAHGIELLNPESTVKAIGSDYKFIPGGSSAPKASLINWNGLQKLTLIGHPGDPKHAYSEIELRHSDRQMRFANLPAAEFVTTNGLKLGMTRTQVLAILGDCMASDRKTGGTERIRYVLEGTPQPPLLAKYNRPKYSALYTFYKDKLILMRFGFDGN